ncbi:intracellular short-chain-length polyhydroxyalkanoate depolymerase [Virgibacillus ihumii]|uniref:intracellular short-chain-length polyhydroxyalkanoate depolymerase n=1 Tax=Virgibacillus ihumii TaxID=2686091 RepID=UPI00157CFDC9|nr:alpha/beta hydrolase [Virgibacillus ihumii]
MVNILLKRVSLPNGEEIAYREREGGDDKVLLVHGNMTSSEHWDVVMENMNDFFNVIAVDLRGFGNSSYHHPIESIKDFSDDLKMFCDQIGLHDFALAGWSLGGAVAQQFCADNPGYANRLFLLASASTRGYAYYATGANGFPDTSNRLTSLDEVRKDGKTKLVQGAYDTKNYDLLRQTWDMLIYRNEKPDPARYEKYLADMTTQRNLAETYHVLNLFNISNVSNGLVDGNGKVEHITIPILITRGDEDLVVSREMTNELIADYGDKAVYLEFSGAGHSPLIDNLEKLLIMMEDFFNGKDVRK